MQNTFFIECAWCHRKTFSQDAQCGYCHHYAHSMYRDEDRDCRFGQPDGPDSFVKECECEEYDRLP